MTDCLIVGGGVIGLSLAYELSCHGMSISLIDRTRPGNEASWAGAGILPPANRRTTADPLEQLRGLSYELHPVWAEQLLARTGIDTGFRRCGGLYLARSVGEAASLAGFAQMLRVSGIDIERLPVGALDELEPSLQPLTDDPSFRAAYLLGDEAQLRNPHHLRALVAACQQLGVEIREGVEAIGLDVRENRLRRVETNTGPLVADQYCIASGAWTFRLLESLGIRTGILPIRGQMVLFQCDRKPFQRVLNEGSRYVVPRDDGRVLVGSTEEEVGFDKSTTAEALSDLTHFGRSLAAPLRQAAIERSWAGLRPGTLDGLPYLGRISELDNAFVAAGHFRSGLQMSTGTAVVLGELIRGATPQIDLGPFRVSRG